MRPDNSSLQRWISSLSRPEWTKRPNAKDDLRRRAIALRRRGLSYREIAESIGAAKGSLSLWLRHVPISEEQRKYLLVRYMEGRRKGAATMKARRMATERLIMSEAAAEIGELTSRELFVAGVIAYWAEGSKSKPWGQTTRVAFVNSDPGMIVLFLHWLDLVGIEKDRLVFRLSIHERADVRRAMDFWAGVVGVPPAQFRRPTLKRHNPKTVRKNVGETYFGCLTITVRRSTELYRRIAGWYEGIMDSIGRWGKWASPTPFEGVGSGSSPGRPATQQSTLFEPSPAYQCHRAS